MVFMPCASQLTPESVDTRTTEHIVDSQDPNSLFEPDAASECGLDVLIDGGNGHALHKLGDTVADGVGRCKGAYGAARTTEKHSIETPIFTMTQAVVDLAMPCFSCWNTQPPPVLLEASSMSSLPELEGMMLAQWNFPSPDLRVRNRWR
jgi:hypothetical protein